MAIGRRQLGQILPRIDMAFDMSQASVDFSTVLARRFWALAAAAFAVGPFIAWQQVESVSPLVAAMVAMAMIVALTWFAEASGVAGWPVRLATFASGVCLSASLLPWTPELLGWLVVLAFAAIAVEDPKPRSEAIDGEGAESICDGSAGLAVSDEEDEDPSVVSSLVRRVQDGYETVEGIVTASANQPTHVVFHPPLSGVPEVELHDVDNCEARLAEATPYGFRVTTKNSGRIAFTAAAPAA